MEDTSKDDDFVNRLLDILEQHDRGPASARDWSRRQKTAKLIIAAFYESIRKEGDAD